MQQTQLNATHRALGAHMVDFGNWEMPLHYGSQIKEHHAVRQNVGVFDVSHMSTLDVSGKNTVDFLRRLLSNDLNKIKPQQALYSLMLNENAGVVDDLIVYFLAPDFARLILNAACAEKDRAHIQTYAQKWGMNLHFNQRGDLSLFALQGPNAWEIFHQSLPELNLKDLKPFHCLNFPKIFVAHTGYTGEKGLECLIPNEMAERVWHLFLEKGAQPCGLGARDTLRLEAGLPLYGHEMDETTNPYNANLGWTIDLKDESRDFLGKSALTPPNAQTLGLILEERGVLREGYTVETKKGEGTITSGSFSPTLGKSIALARLPLEIAVGDGGYVLIRGKKMRAQVVKPPFVRNGKILV